MGHAVLSRSIDYTVPRMDGLPRSCTVSPTAIGLLPFIIALVALSEALAERK
jgi:hypothetical protein